MLSEAEKGPTVHDQVLVETRIDDEAVAIRAVVLNVRPDTLWLGLATPDPRLERLEPDQMLNLTFRRENGALLGVSMFKAHLGSNRGRMFSIARPPETQFVQRRAHLRLETERPIQITVVNQGSSGPAGRTGSGTTRNISAGGVLFVTDMSLVLGDELELEITLPDGEAVPAEAEVVRVQEPESAAIEPAPARPGRPKAPLTPIAVRFITISDVAQDKIVRYIFSQQRQRRDDAK